jgi:hypothetical protein
MCLPGRPILTAMTRILASNTLATSPNWTGAQRQPMAQLLCSLSPGSIRGTRSEPMHHTATARPRRTGSRSVCSHGSYQAGTADHRRRHSHRGRPLPHHHHPRHHHLHHCRQQMSGRWISRCGKCISFSSHFYTKNDRLTKIGSGQT